ncbi:MAG: hypothetical protein R3258_01255 [Acidimicrobiia bacterium]|nr:hypothetical protein [Acidimicrobiia bacterium]
MRAIIGFCVVVATVSACVPRTADPNNPSADDSISPASPSTVVSIPGSGGTPAGPLTDEQVPLATAAIEQALLILGLEPSVTYDSEAARFSVVAVGNVPFNNAQLAERIIGIVGDPSQPGAIVLTHSQLRVRISPNPDSDQRCNCAPQ